MSDIQEPWASALSRAGYTDPRNAERPSWSALGRAVDVHTSTLSAMASGARATSQDTVDKVARALRVDVRTVNSWVGRARSERVPYVPPGDAHLLDRDEREAVDRLIVLLAKAKKGGTSDDGKSEDQKSAPPGNVRPLSAKHQQMLEDAQEKEWAAYDGKGEGDDQA